MGFGLVGMSYLWLSVRVARTTPRSANSAVAYLLFLIGTMLIGATFSYRTLDAGLFNIGRVLTIFAGGFIPVALFALYREYSAGRVPRPIVMLLAVIPAVTTLLALTNPAHELLWSSQVVHNTRVSILAEHYWLANVHKPYGYALLAFALIMLAGSLPTITPAHRRRVRLLLFCVGLPIALSTAAGFLYEGPVDFPFTELVFAGLLPVYWWAATTLRVADFTPLAYKTLFDHVRDAIVVLDTEHRIISVNKPAELLLHESERELIGKDLWRDIPEMKDILDTNATQDLSRTVRLNVDKYYEITTAPLVGPASEEQGTVVVCRDVTVRKRTLRALADSEQLIRTLVEHSSNGILRFARDNAAEGGFRCTFSNKSAERFLTSDAESLIGESLADLPLLRPERLRGRFGNRDREANAGEYEWETEVTLDNAAVWLRVVAEPVGDDFSVTLIDITQRKHAETKMIADALHDPLTGVLNRRGFDESATNCLDEHERAAVLYIDLNHFKAVNDRFGHQAGDALLKAFGHRLEFCLRPEDLLARLGGDEFAIVLPDVGLDDARHVADRLVKTASDAYIVHGEEILCSASVGIALKPDHGSDLSTLVRAADGAMYDAKASFASGEATATPVEAALAS